MSTSEHAGRRRQRRAVHRRRARIGLAVSGLLLAVVLVVGWPQRLGGSALFVVVAGDSMEPRYHSGDLVYARDAGPVGVGDVVVYRVPTGVGAGRYVIHRIVATESGRWILQGDNRPSPDGFAIPPTSVVGRPVRNLGPWPTRVLLVAPYLLATVAAIALVVALWPDRRDADGGPDPGDAPVTPEEAEVVELLASGSGVPADLALAAL